MKDQTKGQEPENGKKPRKPAATLRKLKQHEVGRLTLWLYDGLQDIPKVGATWIGAAKRASKELGFPVGATTLRTHVENMGVPWAPQSRERASRAAADPDDVRYLAGCLCKAFTELGLETEGRLADLAERQDSLF